MAGSSATLQSQFALFAKFGDSKADGKTITLTQCDKWMKQAQVIGKKITTTDTGICFNKLKSKTINFADFEKYVADLAQSKSLPVQDLTSKLTDCGTPGTTNTTAVTNVGGVDRLTDTSKYTGAHKERFDAEGKGKGKEGREETADNSGYVGGYKDKDTYDKTHK